MTWNHEKMQELQKRVVLSLQGKIHLDAPHFRYLYPPEDELVCLQEFETFSKILLHKNYSVECVFLSTLLVEALRSLQYLSNDVLKTESQDRLMIEDNLGSQLPSLIASMLYQRLSGKGSDHCAILLRAGSLFPFVHVSTLLNMMAGMTQCTIVLPYPARRDGEMLDYGRSAVQEYYRGEIL